MMKELSSMLPARFRNKFLKNMPENEAAELLYKYSRFFDVPVTEETAYLLMKAKKTGQAKKIHYSRKVKRRARPAKKLRS